VHSLPAVHPSLRASAQTSPAVPCGGGLLGSGKHSLEPDTDTGGAPGEHGAHRGCTGGRRGQRGPRGRCQLAGSACRVLMWILTSWPASGGDVLLGSPKGAFGFWSRAAAADRSLPPTRSPCPRMPFWSCCGTPGALEECFAARGQGMVVFERYLQLREPVHAHLNVTATLYLYSTVL